MRIEKLCVVILLLLVSGFMNAQTLLKGTVKEAETENVIPGVTVQVTGQKGGVSSDLNGNFEISTSKKEISLVFSSIGYKTKEVVVDGENSITVYLEVETFELGELVVTGYGSQIKADLTGAIGKVKGDELQLVPVSSFESSMQGKVAGVFMTSTTGKLGEAYNIRVRGVSSISAGLQPLYVVDGMILQSEDIGDEANQPINLMMTMDPRDIETIEVLKDASAAAIYGSRASNGVVIITTKSGKYKQQAKTNFGYSVSLQKETNRLEMLNADEYVELFTEAAENSELYWDYGFDNAADFIDWYMYLDGDYSNHDWQDEIFRTGLCQDVYLNSYGGDEHSTYYAGVSFSDQEGILVGNNLERFNSRLKYSRKLNKIVEFAAGLNYARTLLDRVANDNAFATPMQLIAQAPVTPPYLENGEPNPVTVEYFNGLLAMENNKELNRINRTIADFSLSVDIIPGELKFVSKTGTDFIIQNEEARISAKTDD